MENWKLKFVWSWAFKCSVKTYATRLSTECYFSAIQFMWPFYTVSYKVALMGKAVDNKTFSIACHVGLHVGISVN